MYVYKLEQQNKREHAPNKRIRVPVMALPSPGSAEGGRATKSSHDWLVCASVIKSICRCTCIYIYIYIHICMHLCVCRFVCVFVSSQRRMRRTARCTRPLHDMLASVHLLCKSTYHTIHGARTQGLSHRNIRNKEANRRMLRTYTHACMIVQTRQRT
jgi:hypothetical protein